jgi:hypothetical protein
MAAESRRGSAHLAALSVLGQAFVLGLLGLWAAVLGVSDKPHDRVSDALLAVLAVAAGAGLFLMGRGLEAGSRWARAPIMVWELIMLPVGISLAQGIPIAGALLLASAVVALVGVIAGQGAQA